MQNFQAFTPRTLITLMLFSFGLNACASSADRYDNEFDASTRPDAMMAVQHTSIELGPADVIRVGVFGVDELNGEYQIDFEGNVRFPLIGSVAAAGQTPEQFAETLEIALGESYLQDPDVMVSLVESVGQRITVDGSVEKPGIYQIQGNITLLQAVALAGGPGEGANPKTVFVFRQVDGQRMRAAFNLREIREGEAEDPRIYGNDIIVMDGSEARQTYGDMLRAAPFIGLFRFF